MKKVEEEEVKRFKIHFYFFSTFTIND